MIPRLLFRVVPAEPHPVWDAYWARWQALHPTWDFIEYRDPIDPAAFPRTGHRFAGCYNGRQLADHVRLEALLAHGGVYVDADVCPLRPIDQLLDLGCFIGREDDEWCCNAVLGAEPDHPAIRSMLTRMLTYDIDYPEEMGTRCVSAVAMTRNDVTILHRKAFYPYSAYEAHAHSDWPVPDAYPTSYTIHRWARGAV